MVFILVITKLKLATVTLEFRDSAWVMIPFRRHGQPPCDCVWALCVQKGNSKEMGKFAKTGIYQASPCVCTRDKVHVRTKWEWLPVSR